MKFLVILLIALISVLVKANTFDFEIDTQLTAKKAYVLSLQRCKANSPWTIHGLWPQYGMNCGNSFDVNQLAPIRKQLEKTWPTCPGMGDGNVVNFWKHEYTKHGSCMKNISQLQYFAKTLDLHSKLVRHCSSVTKGECRLGLDENLNLI